MRKKLTDTISVQEMAQMYESGMEISDIAACLDTTYQTVWRYLRGNVEFRPRSYGGHCARRIPRRTIEPESRTLEAIAEQNSANACLVVNDHTVCLEGSVGKYTVASSSKIILCSLGGVLVELAVDSIPQLIEELKALARNVDSLNVGCEMW